LEAVELALLDLIDISKTYETNHILNKINFSLHECERVAIIGKNGGGKSTLMKIIHGSLGADEGRRIVQKNIKIGMLDQTPAFKAGMSVKEAIEEQLSELKNALTRYETLLKMLEHEHSPALLEEQSQLATFLEIHDAWSLDEKVQQVMQEFDLKQFENSDVHMLSGGEQRRVTLAGLILQKPDILLLDEPTNHLDMEGKAALAQTLRDYPGGVLLVSHDRQLISESCNRFWLIDSAGLTEWHSLEEVYARLQAVAPAPDSRLALQSTPAGADDDEEALLARLIDLEQWLADDMARKPKHQKPSLQAQWQEEIARLLNQLT